jgi:DME family drug/metabolite transporter
VQAAELAAARRRPARDELATLALALASLGLLTGSPAGGNGETALLGGAGLALPVNGTALAALALHPSPAALGLLAALGAGPTALAYLLYYRSISVIVTAWPPAGVNGRGARRRTGRPCSAGGRRTRRGRRRR